MVRFRPALRKIGRIDEAIAALDRLLALDPRSLSGMLEKGSLQELQGNRRATATTYRAALQMIPPGFKTPQWMDIPLQRARDIVEANNRGLEAFIDEGLGDLRARFSGESLSRFEACVAIMLQKRSIYRQQPTFMYFPGLPAIEFYERDRFPWLDAIEAAADDIRTEYLNALAGGGGQRTRSLCCRYGRSRS